MIMRKILAILLVFSVAAANFGCGKNNTASKPNSFITINGEEVSTPIFVHYMQSVKQSIEEQYGSIAKDAEAAEYIKEQALNKIINLYLAKQSLGRELTDDEIKKIRDEETIYRDMYGKDYDKALREVGLNAEIYFDLLTLTQFETIAYNEMKGDTSEAELRKFYENSMMRIKEIFVYDDGEENPLVDRIMAKGLIEIVYEKAKAGEDFDKLIEDFNMDSNMAQYEDGLLVGRNNPSYNPDWLEIAANLKANGISDIFEIDGGYSILKRLPVDKSKFEENLEISIMMEYWFDKMAKLKATAVVEKNDEIWSRIDLSKGLGKNFGIK